MKLLPTLIMKNNLLILIMIWLLSAETRVSLEAQSIVLDSTFSFDGKVVTDFENGDDQAHALAIQYDGKIVAAGWRYDGAIYNSNYAYDFALARYDTAGNPDSTFGNFGKTSLDFSSLNDRCYAVAIQSNRKIIVAGYGTVAFEGPNIALARYQVDGSLDTTFDGDGKVLMDINGSDIAYSMAIQGDSKIVIAGESHGDFLLARYNENGSLDTAFGQDGKAILDFGRVNDRAQSVVIQNDGQIVVAGLSFQEIILVRYQTNGSIDSTFGVDGLARIESKNGNPVSIALQSDGKIVVTGYSAGPYAIAVLRYTTAGMLDSTFGVNGITIADMGNSSFERSDFILVQNDDKIIVSGQTYTEQYSNFGIVRFHADGGLDNTFDNDGKLDTDIEGYNDEAIAIAIQSDGKIVAAGESGSTIGFNYNFALTRYTLADSLVGVTNAMPATKLRVAIYPNPLISSTLVVGSACIPAEAEDLVFHLYDVLGRDQQVLTTFQASGTDECRATVERGNLRSGLYFYQVLNAGQVVASGKLLVQ